MLVIALVAQDAIGCVLETLKNEIAKLTYFTTGVIVTKLRSIQKWKIFSKYVQYKKSNYSSVNRITDRSQ